ncbi:MAG TPA: hypothetical protein VJ890_19245 [Vineibacter sp.]|nr:hypothetical protein [Vineibacter sp.]
MVVPGWCRALPSGVVAGLFLWAGASGAQTAPAPKPSDGVWVGRAQGGTCTPLDVRITIESGLLDGTASEPDGGAPAVQGKKGEKLPPPPALWQLNGRVGANGAVEIMGLRSMRDREKQRSRWGGRAEAASLTIAETDGPCRRSATMSRGR